MARFKKHRGRKRKPKRKRGGLTMYKKPNQYQTFKVKLETFVQVENTTGGILAYQTVIALNFPLRGITGTAVATGWGSIASVTPQAYTDVIGAFAEYRVDALKVQFFPNGVNTAGIPTGANELANVVYHANDLDDPSVPTEAELLGSGNRPTRINTTGKSHNWIFKQLKQNRGKYLRVLNIGEAPTTAPVAYINNIGFANAYASMKIFFPTVAATNTPGRLYMSWYCTFRNLLMF